MTAELIRRLRREDVFDPAPRREDLAAVHVPFDELTDTTRVEAAVRRAIDAADRIGVVGPSGSGKSSVLAWCCNPLEPEIAPIVIPASVEPDEVLTRPPAFAQHVLRQLARNAGPLAQPERDRLLRDSTDRMSLPTRQRRRAITLPSILGRTPALAHEVVELTAQVDHPRSGIDVVDLLSDALRLFDAHRLQPVLVIDDTDHWLEGGGDRAHLIAPFFGPVLRMLNELPACVLVAVHDRYLTDARYQASPGFLTSLAFIPRLERLEAIEQILTRRLVAHHHDQRSPAPPLAEVVDGDALQLLAEFYLGPATPSLRRLLRVAHRALDRATGADHAIVTEADLRAAIGDDR